MTEEIKEKEIKEIWKIIDDLEHGRYPTSSIDINPYKIKYDKLRKEHKLSAVYAMEYALLSLIEVHRFIKKIEQKRNEMNERNLWYYD